MPRQLNMLRWLWDIYVEDYLPWASPMIPLAVAGATVYAAHYTSNAAVRRGNELPLWSMLAAMSGGAFVGAGGLAAAPLIVPGLGLVWSWHALRLSFEPRACSLDGSQQ
jgi:hypothetical protein